MKNKLIIIACSAVLLVAGTADALDASGQRYTKMLASGGVGSIQSAAEDIYNTGVNDQEVLDVAAQALSDIYLKNPNSPDYSQATAWLCKALGNSANGRYRPLLETVVKADIHRKTRKYCDKALDGLPKGASSAPFQAGAVDLTRYRDGGAAYSGAASKPAPAAKSAPAAASNKKVDFSLIKEGMSSQEVDELIGSPTNQTTYMTGKQFQPFNFGARDVQRTKYLYKGVGHIVFSLKSGYNGVFRVIEIVPDPGETGYP